MGIIRAPLSCVDLWEELEPASSACGAPQFQVLFEVLQFQVCKIKSYKTTTPQKYGILKNLDIQNSFSIHIFDA